MAQMEVVFTETKQKFYIEIAKLFATRSKDPKTKVGCVIVTPTGILYPGYNGDEMGGSNTRDSLETGDSGFIHAEENAIIKFDPSIHVDSKMFLTHSPCKMCAKRIVNTCAITEVYYDDTYKSDISGLEILDRHGIFHKKVG